MKALAPELKAEMRNDILVRSPSAAISFSVVAIICFLTGLFSNDATIVRIISSTIILTNVARFYVARKALRAKNSNPLYSSFVGLTAFNGILWGTMFAIISYDISTSSWGFITAFSVYTAFSNASIFTLSSSSRLHASFILGLGLPIWAAMLARYIQDGGHFYLAFAIFITIMMLYCLMQGRSFRLHFILKWEADTALLKSQKALIEQRAMTEHVNRLSSIGEMAAGFAHEINNPLAIVIGNLDILETELEDKKLLDDQVKKAIDRSIASATRIAKIIKGLRTLSRASSREGKTPNHLGEILEDTLVLFDQRIVNHKITLTVDNLVEKSFPCDPIQVGQVIVNLLSNACDELMLMNESEKRWIKLLASIKDNQIVVEVINSGPPVSEEIRQKIFTPFFTTKPVGQGMGLGLVISRSIAVQHGGSLEVDTLIGRTRFTLKLPLNGVIEA